MECQVKVGDLVQDNKKSWLRVVKQHNSTFLIVNRLLDWFDKPWFSKKEEYLHIKNIVAKVKGA